MHAYKLGLQLSIVILRIYAFYPCYCFYVTFRKFLFLNCLQIFLWKRTHACIYTRRAGEMHVPTFAKRASMYPQAA